MKVWISKYALSDGIIEDEAERADWDERYVLRPGFMNSLRLGGAAHETREAAVKAAKQMRIKKIASLKKQIAKLEAMKFE